jgi:hypothetical protein
MSTHVVPRPRRWKHGAPVQGVRIVGKLRIRRTTDRLHPFGSAGKKVDRSVANWTEGLQRPSGILLEQTVHFAASASLDPYKGEFFGIGSFQM